MGTTVGWLDANNEVRPIADLVRGGMRQVLVRGGDGGRGNRWFATPANQEPLLAEVGDEGEALWIVLEVMPVADVAIVGGPNSGKSTLLAQMSAAKPKIAAYPFTTTRPVVGVVRRKGREVVAVDTPALVEGAHHGKGLGTDALRQAERAEVLLQLIDGAGEDVVAEYELIDAEIQAYGGGLAQKDRLVVLNKIDLPEVREGLDGMRKALAEAAGVEVIGVAAVSGEGVEVLVERVIAMVPADELDRDSEAEVASEEEKRRTNERPRVERDEAGFVVRSRSLERIARRVDLNNWRTRLQFHGELERLGVIDLLERAGVESGDTVRIAERELEWD